MELDPPPSSSSSNKQKAESLYELATGNLSTTLSNLSSSSKAIPPEKEFHFFNNFKEFKLPMKEINSKSKSLLSKIDPFKGKTVKNNCFDDLDDAYDWLVDFNDDVFERMDVDIDEFERMRKVDEETGGVGLSGLEDDGFQLVTGRNSKKNRGGSVRIDVGEISGQISGFGGESKVKVADKKTVGGKAKVPFHIPTIPRPQDQFKILVNNANTPFQHVWLQRSEDGSKFIHPLEELSVLDFVDRNLGDGEILKPLPLEGVPFKLVEEVKDLKELAAKLRSVDEFAVDLEHNQYRSFQGLTCLMQISTRTEDFVIDTLKLRIHIGPYLREVFKDPLKKKVMHGADRDIIWLQRDFGIYVCNLFDTGQASRVLKMERNSLEYLLNHFCEVAANKEYQNADWRLRPLPAEMTRYAREDTHYLLHIYDLMRKLLISMPKDSENSDEPLVEVYKRSYDICMLLYEKELLTDDSYLHVYGLQTANFNAQQLAVVAALCEWRDVIAREEDESTGYILPNKSLLEIAKQMPVTANKLRNLVKSKHPYVERSIGSVVSIIRHAIQNSSAFEAIAEQLKEGRSELMRQVPGEAGAANGADDLTTVDNATADSMDVENTDSRSMDGQITMAMEDGLSQVAMDRTGHDTDGLAKIKIEKDTKVANSISMGDSNAGVTGASVQVLKKPSRGFGALLGNASQKKKIDLATKGNEVNKLEQIKSSVTLPFHSFSGKDENLKSVAEKQKDTPKIQQEPQQILTSSALGDVISLEDDSVEPENAEQEPKGNLSEDQEKSSWISDTDEPMSLSELSSSFKKCLPSSKQARTPKQGGTSQEAAATIQIEPFDYEAARQQVKFGEYLQDAHTEDGGIRPRHPAKKGKTVSSEKARAQRDDESGGFAPGKRRQAFPASGNRSATFRSS